jgi:Protein of unknown function (DUF2877)
VIVASPVLERLGGRSAVVAGANRHAAYLDLDGFVVIVGRRGDPMMPNGIALDGPLPAPGERVVVDDAELWDPTLRLPADPASEILDALGSDVPDALWRALETGDPTELIGRGPGLTPEGDDYLAGAVAVLAARGHPVRLPADLRARTTALSATLLELAAAGYAIDPLHALFGRDWRAALERLVRLGHSTGRAYAVGAAAAMIAVTRRDRRTAGR